MADVLASSRPPPPAVRPLARQPPAWRRTIPAAARNKGVVVGALLLGTVIAGVVLAPLVAPYDPYDPNYDRILVAPSWSHPFGTDDLGRDIFSRVLHGGRISLRMGLIAVAISTGIGTLVGLAAGYYGGWIDGVLMRLADVLLAFPGILLALAIVTALGPSLLNAMLAVGISGIPSFARVARSITLSIKQEDYVLGARALGCTNLRIVLRYVLANGYAALVVLATLRIGQAILSGAALSFLGMGAQPPTPEWGAMLSAGRIALRHAWWVSTFPGLAIMLTVLAINMLGDGLREVVDPKLRR